MIKSSPQYLPASCRRISFGRRRVIPASYSASCETTELHYKGYPTGAALNTIIVNALKDALTDVKDSVRFKRYERLAYPGADAKL